MIGEIRSDCIPPCDGRAARGVIAVTLAVASAASLVVAGNAFAQTYPTKPIRFIVPVTIGGGSDLIARALGQKYFQAWGQQVVVDNRPGAGIKPSAGGYPRCRGATYLPPHLNPPPRGGRKLGRVRACLLAV